MKKCTDVLQTIATWGLFIVAGLSAGYGFIQYKTLKAEKRPYISLTSVIAKSSLAGDDLISYSDVEKGLITPAELLCKEPAEYYKYEDIVVELLFKNTGPVGALGCKLSYATFGFEGEIKDLKSLWATSEKHHKQLSDRGFNLMPEQEQVYGFVFKRYELYENEETKNLLNPLGEKNLPMYVLCRTEYGSMKDLAKPDNKRDKFISFDLYQITHIRQNTYRFNAHLIQSE